MQDAQYIEELTKRYSRSIGFLPKVAIAKYIEWGLVELGLENDEPAGYVLYKLNMPDNPGITAIFQTAVQMDARRHSIGQQLVRLVIQKSIDFGNQLIQLWCASDLEANEFWSAAGFQPHAMREVGKKRKRLHILWRRASNEESNMNLPVSGRRRNVNGHAVLVPASATKELILKACKEDRCLSVWKEIKTAGSIASYAHSSGLHGASDSSQDSLFG